MKVQYANYAFQSCNIGDMAQVYALDVIYRRMGLSHDDIFYFNRDTVCHTIDPNYHYILPLVTADLSYFDLIEYLVEQGLDKHFSFVPLALGQTRWTFRTEDRLGKFRHIINRFELPIGCRDYDSEQMYKSIGYPTYTGGCITNTLPKRQDGQYDTIYFIDVPQSFLAYVPSNIRKNAVFLTQMSEDALSLEQNIKRAVQRYELLRDTAALIVTARYHVATPCNAMGIPTIMIENDQETHHWTFDPRLTALNPNIPFYAKEQWEHINWNPCVTDFETQKQVMTDLIISRIQNSFRIACAQDNLSTFFATSKKKFWDTFESNKHNIDLFDLTIELDRKFLSNIKNPFRFYLYGLSDYYLKQNECILLDYIQRHYPDAEFLGFVDSKKHGAFLGKQILHPDDMKIDANTYCLVSAYTANNFVEDLFEKNKFDITHLWKMHPNVLFYVYHL